MAAEWTKAEEVQWDALTELAAIVRDALPLLGDGVTRMRLAKALDKVDDAFEERAAE